MMAKLTSILCTLIMLLGFVNQASASGPIVLHKNINITNLDVRSSSKTLTSIYLNAPTAGKVVVRFDGECIASVGDRIVLAASNTSNWQVNDGNVSVEAVNSDVNGNSFSHTRVYDLAAGGHRFYAIAHNYVERAGTGKASIYGTLTVEFYPTQNTPSALVYSQRISKTNIELQSAAKVLARQSIYVATPGKVIVRFDGQCIADVGDRIVLAASDDPNWHVNDGNTSMEAINRDLNRESFSHTRVYTVPAGTHNFYAVAHNYVETTGSGVASIYGTLTVEFLPTPTVPEPFVVNQNIAKTRIDVKNQQTVVGQKSISVSKPGKVVVRFDGKCVSTPGDRIVLAASNDAKWHVNDGSVGVEAYSNDINGNPFSHTRVYRVRPGRHTFHAVAHNYVEYGGDGKASIYGTLTVQFYPDEYDNCPNNLPNPVIALSQVEDYTANGREWTRYSIPVQNSSMFPNYLFDASPNLPACGLNNEAARTWVRIYDQDNNYIYGFCALGEASDLSKIWFARPKGECPPKKIYIQLIDRLCNKTYTSNLLTMPDCTPACPDLVITDLKVTAYSSTNIKYSYTIKNVGTAPVDLNGPTNANHDNVSVQAFVSKDAIFNNGNDLAAGGTIVGASPLPTLAPGQTYSVSFGATVNFDVAAYPYLTMKVDWGKQIDECNERNNTASTLIDRTCSTTYRKPVIELERTENYVANGKKWTRYHIPVINSHVYSDALFQAAPDLPACGLNNEAARTWVRIYDQDDNYLYGFCALSEAIQLENLWFATEQGKCPPQAVYIELIDRRCNKSYKSNLVYLQAAASPKIKFESKEEYTANGQTWIRYNIPVVNTADFPDLMFESAPDLPACGLNNEASRTWVNIYGTYGNYIYGFCALNEAADLSKIWFALPKGQCPPSKIYITLRDRRCDRTYRSNSIEIPCTRGLANNGEGKSSYAIPSTENSLTVAPNPVSVGKDATLNIVLAEESSVAFELYTIDGKKVKDLPLLENAVAGQHTLSFSTQNLNKGIYLLKGNMGKELVTQKLVVTD